MNITDYVSEEEVRRVCQEMGIRDWTKLTDTQSTARGGRNYPGRSRGGGAASSG